MCASASRHRAGTVAYCECQMSDPRKHHIVPQLYQKGFARPHGKAWYAVVLDRESGRARPPSNIRDIFAERDYNTILDADGTRTSAPSRCSPSMSRPAPRPGSKRCAPARSRSATSTGNRSPSSRPRN